MATKNFRSTVLEPTSEFAHGDKLRFTALATVGEVLKGSFSETTIGEDGVYSIDLQYGKHRIDYKPYEGVWRHFSDVEVNADTLATTLQDLALSSVPVTDETILVLQGILSDAEAVKTEVAAARDEAEASAEAASSSASEAKLALSMSITFYVDPDFAGESDGSSSKPFTTIKEAIESCPDRHLIVRCSAGKTHVINSRIDAMHLLSLSIVSDGSHTKAELKFSHVAAGGVMTVGGIIVKSSVMIRTYHISLIIDDYVDTSSALALYSSAAISTTDLSLAALVVLDSTSITYSGIALISAGSAIRSSKADVLIGDSQINRQSSIRSNAKLFEAQTGSLSATNLALSGVTSSQLVQNIASWQSNVAWS